MKGSKIAAILAAAIITITGAVSDIFPANRYSEPENRIIQAYAADSYTNDIKGFITRMYNVCLDKDPSDKVISNWTAKLNSHVATGADVVVTFFNSSEYKSRGRTNAQIVSDCYNAVLGRNPDSSGAATWQKHLDVGMTVNDMCKGLVQSSEFKTLCSAYGIQVGSVTLKNVRDENFERTYFVYRLYANCLGRYPDISGLENWCVQLKNGYTGAKIVQGFVCSNEYKSKNTSNTEFVTMLYNTLLGRGPDATGLNNWVAQLNSGKSRNYVINGFLFSTEFKGQCARAGISVGTKLPE